MDACGDRGRDRSSTRSTRSATAIACCARATPSTSTGSSVSRETGGVDQRDAQPLDVDDLGHQIARRARHVGDDGARRAGERVEQARLADVRLADDRDLQPFANQPAAARVAEQRRTSARAARRSPAPAAPARRSDSPLPGKSTDASSRAIRSNSVASMRGDRARQRAVELIERRARLQRRHGVDQIVHRLRLHQIDPTVEKRAQRELAGLGQPRAARRSPRSRSPAAPPDFRARSARRRPRRCRNGERERT